MVLYKWLAFGVRDSSAAPSILIHFINMFVMQGKDITPLYPGQVRVWRNLTRSGCVCVCVCFNLVNAFFCSIPQIGLQIFLIVIAMLSVPVLLLGKPLYLYWLYRGGKGLRRRRVCEIRHIGNIFDIVFSAIKITACWLTAGLWESEACEWGRLRSAGLWRWRRRRGSTGRNAEQRSSSQRGQGSTRIKTWH